MILAGLYPNGLVHNPLFSATNPQHRCAKPMAKPQETSSVNGVDFPHIYIYNNICKLYIYTLYIYIHTIYIYLYKYTRYICTMSFTQQGNHSAFPDRELQRAVYSPGMGF